MLIVDTAEAGGSVVKVTGVERANAALVLEPIANEEIAVTMISLPEPGVPLQLAVGVVGLAALHGLRRRPRRKRR